MVTLSSLSFRRTNMVEDTLEQRACDRHTEDADFVTKIFFSDEAHFDLGAQKTRTHTLKSRRTQNVSLFGVDFGPEA